MDQTTSIPDLTRAILDSLDDQTTVIDRLGNILYVNGAWIRFGEENGGADSSTAANYFDACRNAADRGDKLAARILTEMRAVTSGEADTYSIDYPCHTPRQERWFTVRIKPLVGYADLFVISHIDVTRRVLAENSLAELAYSDGLTLLANRRRFDETLRAEWRRRSRARVPISVLMIDVDHFKQFNDRYGHEAGDRCLQLVAAAIKAIARRTSDLAARYGGEEFALVLSDTGHAEALGLATRLCGAVRELAMPDGITTSVTVSIGVASASGTWSGDAEKLVRRADELLYAAKRAGRDRALGVEIED